MNNCRCNGITLKGIQCKRTVKKGQLFCFKHTLQEFLQEVDQPSTLHETVYNKILCNSELWPTLKSIHYDFSYKIYDTFEDVKNVLNNSFFVMTIMDSDKIILFVFSCELLILNNKFKTNPEYTKISRVLQNKLWFEERFEGYRMFMYKKCDIEYDQFRLQHTRNYIEHIFSKSELGPDIAKYIANAYTL
jgi:hypothetical protein